MHSGDERDLSKEMIADPTIGASLSPSSHWVCVNASVSVRFCNRSSVSSLADCLSLAAASLRRRREDTWGGKCSISSDSESRSSNSSHGSSAPACIDSRTVLLREKERKEFAS